VRRRDPHLLRIDSPQARRRERSVRTLLLALGILLLVTAVLLLTDARQSVTFRLPNFRMSSGWISAVVGAISATLAAMALIRLMIVERRRRNEEALVTVEEQHKVLAQHVRSWTPSAGVPLVKEIEDPVQLGIKAPARIADVPESTLPPYLPRGRDKDLNTALDTSKFVLLVGDSAAGKTRSAFEAILRRFGDRRIVIPTGHGSLNTLLDLRVDFHDTVVWLDDLQDYLGPEGITVDTLNRLLASGGSSICVMSTIRAIPYDQYRSASRQVTSPEGKVLEQAKVVHLRRQLDPEERRLANIKFTDARLLTALERYGLGEYFAAGPELVDRFENGASTCPAGQAIVRAAIDWRRAGLKRPVPRRVLREMNLTYVDQMTEGLDQGSQFDLGLTWAQDRVVGTTALLTSYEDGFVVSDYILDYVEREWRTEVPRHIWDLIVEAARDGAEALDVGVIAFSANLDIAERAFRKASSVSTVSRVADYYLAVLLERRGEEAEAERYYLAAADARSVPAMYNFAILLQSSGRAEEAERWYQRAADAGHLDAAVNLGVSLYQRGNRVEAERWYRQAAEAGIPAAAFNLALLLRDTDPQQAESWYRQAAEAGIAAAANSLGVILEQRGNYQAAREWYSRAADAGHELATENLDWLFFAEMRDEATRKIAALKDEGARFHMAALELLEEVEGQFETVDEIESTIRQMSEESNRRLAAAGNPFATYDYAVLLHRSGREQEAKKWYLRAEEIFRPPAERGDPDAAYRLGLVLYDQGLDSEAEMWFRRAMERGDPDPASRLIQLFRKRGALDEAIEFFAHAAETGNTAAGTYLTGLFEERKGREEAEANRIAAGEGDMEAAVKLARYLEHRGALEEADKWCQRAGHAGNPDALFYLAQKAYDPITGVVRPRIGFDSGALRRVSEAQALYRQAAELGHPEAAYYLGVMAEMVGNRKEAVEWYSKAAASGHRGAGRRLKG
jgi:TPR repeat protein